MVGSGDVEVGKGVGGFKRTLCEVNGRPDKLLRVLANVKSSAGKKDHKGREGKQL